MSSIYTVIIFLFLIVIIYYIISTKNQQGPFSLNISKKIKDTKKDNIIKKTEKKYHNKEKHLNAIKGALIHAEQASEELEEKYLNKNSKKELTKILDLLKKIKSNLKLTRYELRKIKRKEHNKHKKQIKELYSYVDYLLFEIYNTNIVNNLPENSHEITWNQKIRIIKENVKKIKIGCGHLIKSLETLSNLFEHKLKNTLSELKPEYPTSQTTEELNDTQNSEPYFVNAPSTNVFYGFPPTYDQTGMLNPTEEQKRLYSRPPLFDNQNFYSMSTEITNLFQQYISTKDFTMSHFREYLAEIDYITNHLQKFPKECNSALIIPTYQEEKSIKKTLEKYANCSRSQKVAIFLLENHPKNKNRDNTFLEIQKFRKTNPNIKVFHIYKIFETRVPIGLIRKYITDVALMLKIKSNHTGNLILIGGDADCVEIHKNFFSKIISKFYKNDNLDAIEMKLNFPLKYQFAFPNMWIMHRFFDFCWSYKRNKITPNKAIRMYGPASAIKASSYLMIKGFNPRASLCEDLELSYMLDSGRRNIDYNSKKQFFEYSSISITTNPRRALSAYLSGMNLLGMYSDFEERDDIRTLSWEHLVTKKGKGTIYVGNTFSSSEIREFINSKKEIVPDMGSYLSVFLQESIDWWKFKVEHGWLSQNQFEKMLKKVMNWLKIKYSLDISDQYWTITILNIDKLLIGMNKILKQKHKERFETNIHAIIVDHRTYNSN